MKNTLISIGHLGIKKCFLNISEEEAIKRYCELDNITIEQFEDYGISIYTIEFDDTFGAYDVWEL